MARFDQAAKPLVSVGHAVSSRGPEVAIPETERELSQRRTLGTRTRYPGGLGSGPRESHSTSYVFGVKRAYATSGKAALAPNACD